MLKLHSNPTGPTASLAERAAHLREMEQELRQIAAVAWSHAPDCRCDTCRLGWMAMGPDPDTHQWGPFSYEEMQCVLAPGTPRLPRLQVSLGQTQAPAILRQLVVGTMQEEGVSAGHIATFLERAYQCPDRESLLGLIKEWVYIA